MKNAYVHGYDPRENIRLQDQASTLEDLLHTDTYFPAKSRVLEVGCGVGAQTVPLAKNSPQAQIISMDISMTSLKEARQKAEAAGITNVRFLQGDLFSLSFSPASFDYVFVCFVLEHLARPDVALLNFRKMIRPGGTIMMIEGDHGSAYFHPDSEAARQAILCQVALQRRGGGNANIGRALYPMLKKSGFRDVQVSPRMVYADASKPKLVEGFTKKTFTAMIEGVRAAALEAGLMDERTFEQGIRDLYRTAENDGVFCYTFFKAVAQKE